MATMRGTIVLAMLLALGSATMLATAKAQSAGAQSPGPPSPRTMWPSWEAIDPYGWGSPTVDGADVLIIDDAPLPLAGAVRARGPLQRFASRPGAWYSAAFLPLSPRWPVQVWLWQRAHTHEVRVAALDAAPWSTPSVSVPIPVRSAPARGRPVLLTAPVVLQAGSRADGVFLLIEQWNPAGERPGPLWLQARSRVVLDADNAPMWSPWPDDVAASLAPVIPPSPLNAPRNASAVVELPIMERLPPRPARESASPR